MKPVSKYESAFNLDVGECAVFLVDGETPRQLQQKLVAALDRQRRKAGVYGTPQDQKHSTAVNPLYVTVTRIQ